VAVPTPPKGKPVDIYVAMVLPASAGGGIYFKGADGKWVPYGDKNAPPYEKGVTGTQSVGLSRDDKDKIKSIPGAQIYVGYGSGQYPFNDMLSNGTYSLVNDPASLFKIHETTGGPTVSNK